MSELAPLPSPPLGDGEVRIITLDAGDRATVRDVARRILGTLLGASNEDVEIYATDNGKPQLRNDPSLYFSISHSHDAAMIAVTRVAAVGVDVERLRAVPNMEAILRRFFPDDELDSIRAAENRELSFVQAWTRAEARVKARGASIWDAAKPDPGITVRQIVAPEGYAAAVAVAHPTWNVVQYSASVADVVGT